jgi:hypothetical protein
VEEKQSMMSGVIQCFCCVDKRGRGSAHFRRGMEDMRQLEDATAWRCATAANSHSQVMSGLTRGGRQSVKPVEPKGCLGQILSWKSNTLPK